MKWFWHGLAFALAYSIALALPRRQAAALGQVALVSMELMCLLTAAGVAWAWLQGWDHPVVRRRYLPAALAAIILVGWAGAALGPMPGVLPLETLESVAMLAIAAPVVPGGEQVTFYRAGTSHVAFYTAEGLAVCTGHVFTKLVPGLRYPAWVRGADGSVQVIHVLIVGSYWFGQAVAGLPVPDRPPVNIAAAAGISTGHAEYVVRGEPKDASIVGVKAVGGEYYLVLVASERFRPGQSGCPIIQDGRLVGVVGGSQRLNPRRGVALPAATIYLELVRAGLAPPLGYQP